MKKKVKANRILAVLCAFAMIVTLFPGGVFYGDVFAAEGDKTEAVTTEGDAAETEETKEEPVVTEEEPVEEKAPENAAEPAAPTSDETVQKAEPQEKTESQDKKEEPAAEKTEAEKKTETVSEDKDKTKAEDKKDEEKEADKKDSEEEKLFKVEFDFTDNYACFNKISAKTTDTDGVIILPKKPEARKALYKDEAGSEYYFTGWKYKGEEYEPGDKVKLDDDATFKAVWKQTYTVEFSTKGIEAEEVEPQTEVYGEPVVLPDETATKDGYDFIGWTPDKGDTVFAPDTSISAKRIQPKRSAPTVRLLGVTEDTTKPDVYIQFVSKDTDAGKVTFKVIAMDKGSGIDTVQYSINDGELITIDSGTTVDVNDGDTLTVVAKDKAGNESDHEPVTADIGKEYGTADPVITVETVDGESGEAAAATAKKEHVIEFSVDKTDCTVKAFMNGEDLSGSITSESGKYKLNVSGDGLDGENTVSLIAIDAEDRYTEKEIICIFDTTAPKITSFKMEGAKNGYYYGKEGNWVITAVADEDLASAEFVIDGKTFTGIINNKTATLTVDKNQFAEVEKECAVKVVVKDAAENENSEANQTLSDVEDTEGVNDSKGIVIDTKAPTLNSVATNPGGILHAGDYHYNKIATTVYTVQESYPNKDTVELQYNFKESKDAAETGELVNTYKQNGAEVTIEGKWEKKGIFSEISLSLEDMAGNKLVNDYTSGGEDKVDSAGEGKVDFKYKKIIDNDPPKITQIKTTTKGEEFNSGNHLFGGKYYYNEFASTVYTVTDENLVSVKLTYKKDGEDAAPIEVTASSDETELSITVDWDSEAEYTDITLTALDAAGNGFAGDIKIDDIRPEDKPTINEDGAAEFKGKVIDKTAPEYTSRDFTTVSSGAVPDGSKAYYQGSIEGFFDIDEKNFNKDLISVDKAVGNVGESDNYSNIEPEWPTSISGGTNYTENQTYRISISGNGVYRFVIQGEDMAGNKLKKAADNSSDADKYNATVANNEQEGRFWSYIKIIDDKKPELTLTIADKDDLEKVIYKHILKLKDDGETLEETVKTYKPFQGGKEGAKKALITVEAKDNSPVYVSYDIVYRKPGDSGTIKEGDKATFSDNRKINNDEMKQDVQFTVENIEVMDRAGNKTEMNKSRTVYLDGTKPDPSKPDVVSPVPSISIKSTSGVTHRSADGTRLLYNDTVNLSFKAKDPNKNNSSSGLKRMYYTVTVDGVKKIDEKKLNEKNWTPSTDSDVSGKLVYSTDELSSELKKELKAKIEKGKYESNDITVTIYAEDNAGNVGKATLTFGIDSQGPQIVVTYNNNSAQNEKYFKENRTATVTVTERNLGENSNKIKIKTQVTVPGSWNYSAGGASSGNSDKWIKKLKYNKDGDYTLSISGTDALGNPASVSYQGTAPKKFTIDKTAPVITVTFDNNNVRNGKYYNANRTATVKIKEHNFRASDVKAPVKATGPRNGRISAPSISGFSSNGDTRTATIPFTKEGSFSFDVKYTDLAGNPAKVVKISEFVIDKTAPVVRIENVVNGGIYGGTVAPRAIFDDDTFNRSDSTFRFTGVRKVDRSELVPSFSPNGEYGGSYVLNDFPYVKVNDDVYTAYATSTDMAGNTTTVSVTFSVNRFGSAYDYNKDKATEDLVAKNTGRYYTNVKTPLQLREFNVNHIKSYELTLNRGGSSVKLEEGKDYTVVKTEGDQGVQYVYKIKDSIITDEGKYEIVARSEDEAGNINSNAAIRAGEDEEDNNSEVPLRFVYDTTAPTVSFVDHDNTSKTITLEEGENGKNKFKNMEKLMLGIVPEDDWALGAIQYVLKDKHGNIIKDSGVIKGDEFWEVMGEDGIRNFLEEIDHGADVKTLEVTIWDAAGNESTQIYKISVTKNLAEQAMANWYWILLVLAAGGGGGYAYYRKRREDGENSEDGEDDAA